MANEVSPSRLKSLALYSDVNRNFGQEGAADLLLDKYAISQSLFNIFHTSVGEAGPIFLPDLGSALPMLLQEPLGPETAFAIKAAAIQAAQRWETRIDVDVGQTVVAVDNSLPGYIVRFVYTIRQTGEVATSNLPLRQFGSDNASLTPPESAPPAWTPTSGSGLELWFDAADARSVLQSLTGLTRWKDKSGKGYIATVTSTSGANSFALKQAAINGLSAIRLATGTSPNSMSLSAPVSLQRFFHMFVVARNSNPSFLDLDHYGFDLLPSQLGEVLKVAYGLESSLGLPSVSSTQGMLRRIQASFLNELNGTTPCFIELKFEDPHLTVFVNRSQRVTVDVPNTFSSLVLTDLLRCFGAIAGDPSLYLGELMLLNSSTAIDPAEVLNTRNYLYSKWLSEAIETPAVQTNTAVVADVIITSALMPRISPSTQDIKITIQHTRTSTPQPIQFKVLASGPGVADAQALRSGSVTRYESTDIVTDNPVVFDHTYSPYSPEELSGPFGRGGVWNELLSYGLVFNSTASTSGRTEFLISFPTGLDLAYPGVFFDDVTLTVIPVSFSLALPAVTTFHLPPVKPVANFTTDVVTGPAPLTVNFKDVSSGPPTQWTWDFDNSGGVDSTEKSPSHTYTDPGTYSVRLIAANAKGSDVILKTGLIRVTAADAVSDPFLANVVLLLHAEASEGTTTFVDSSFRNTAVTTVGNGKITTSDAAYGLGSLDFRAANSAAYASYTDLVMGDFTYETTVKLLDVAGNPVLLSLDNGPFLAINSSNSCLSIGIGNSINRGNQLLIPNVYNHVALTKRGSLVQAWLNGYLSATAEFASLPPLSVARIGYVAGGTTTRALFDEVRLTAGVCRYPVHFTPIGPFPDGSLLPPLPVVNFSASKLTGAIPLTVHFTDLTQNEPYLWQWELETLGVVNSTEQNPTYTYNTAGTFPVRLTAYNARGEASKTVVGMITTVGAPVPDFSATPVFGTPPLTVQFTDKSQGSPTSWEWDFNDNGVVDSRQQNPSFVYDSVGVYTVVLKVTNAFGSVTKRFTNVVTVGTPPVAEFLVSPTGGVAPLTVNFTNTTTGQVDSYLWEFGDGTTSTEVNP